MHDTITRTAQLETALETVAVIGPNTVCVIQTALETATDARLEQWLALIGEAGHGLRKLARLVEQQQSDRQWTLVREEATR